MKIYHFFLIVVLLFFLSNTKAYCQKNDTAIIMKDSVKPKIAIADSSIKHDSAIKKKRDPTKATLFSAIVPGLGQIYNRKYWKLPLVYAAVGIPVYEFFDNKAWYNRTRYALTVIANNPDVLMITDSATLSKVHPLLRGRVQLKDVTNLIKYRDEFRKDQDYSVLFFLLFYALQIVDATVDAHLRDFNVNDDLSFHFKPNIYSGNTGLSLVFDIHKAKPKTLFDNR